MKIVLLVRLYAPHIGGVEKHVQKITDELIRLRHQVTIVTEQYTESLPEEEVVGGATVIRIPVAKVGEWSKKFVIWRWFFRCHRLLSGADIIHIHDVVFWVYLYKLLHPSRRIFATFHGWEGVYPIPPKNILQRRLDAAITAGNICIGDYIAKWYGIKPTLVSYGAVSHSHQARFKLTHPPVLLFLGRLEDNTGWRECVARYRRLKSRIGWRLVVAGDGPLKGLAPPEASVLGVVGDPRALITNATYVFTSGYLGILEAMAAGRIVLSHAENPLKADYLRGHPMAKFIALDDNLPTRLPPKPKLWARNQTWPKLANQYLRLWRLPQS